MKEKNKPQALGWSSSRQSRKIMEEDMESKVDQQRHDSHLEKCRDHLKSILLHWEPAFAVLSTKPPAEHVGTEESHDDTNSLVRTTAYVVVKWVLKAMAEHSVSWQNVFEVLQWLKTSILSHAAVVEEIIRDCVLKSVIYKLYNRVSDASLMMTFNFDVIHLFNMVMIQLLDAQGLQKPSFHQSVKDLCQLAGNEEDEQKKAVVVFLVSTYIGDMWLGAHEPVTFTTHVRAIGDATNKLNGKKENTPKRKRQKQAEEAIVTVCKDISVAILGH